MKVGRNEPCPCGSGKKYKHCCYAKDSVKHEEPLLEANPEEDPADGESAEATGSEGGARERDHDRNTNRSKFHGGGPRGRGGPSSPRVFRGAQRGN